jgi:hypothetical protein
MCELFTTIGTAIATSMGLSVAAAGASAAGATVISSTAATVIGGVAVGGAAAGLLGTAVGAVSSYSQGKSQQAMYNYQAQVAEQNRKIALQNAAVERQSGIEEARLQRIKTLQAVGSQETAMAANGMDVTQGTSLDILEDTSAMGELDALQIQYNSEKKALVYEQQADNYANEANLDRLSGKNAYKAGVLNTVSSGLNGLSKSVDVATKWTGFGS